MEKLFESELKLMEIVWEKEPVSAKDVSLAAAERVGWNKNTTYTVIKKLIDKNVIKREEPGFICTSLVSRGEVQRAEAKSLTDRLFGGSKSALFSALVGDEGLSRKDIEELRQLIEGKK